MIRKNQFIPTSVMLITLLLILNVGCSKKQEAGGFGDAASKVYVAPGSYDEFYAFMSGDLAVKFPCMVYHPDDYSVSSLSSVRTQKKVMDIPKRQSRS